MKNQIKLSTGILALAMMLMCISNALAQAQKATVTSGPVSLSSNSGSQLRQIKSGTQGVTSVNTASSSSSSELSREKEKLNSSTHDVNDLQVALVSTKVKLEMGMRQNTLSPQEIKDLKSKIANIEARQSKMKTNNADVIANNNEASQSKAVMDILAAKQFSRAGFLALSALEQKQVLLNMKSLTITDLVNATPEALKVRSSNVFYISVDDFKNAGVTRQGYMLKNPSSNMIVSNESMIPKTQISREAFNALSPEKKQALLDSKKINVVD